jgi:hypothetical protein
MGSGRKGSGKKRAEEKSGLKPALHVDDAAIFESHGQDIQTKDIEKRDFAF